MWRDCRTRAIGGTTSGMAVVLRTPAQSATQDKETGPALEVQPREVSLRQNGVKLWSLGMTGSRRGSEILAIEVNKSMPTEWILPMLEQVITWQGQPKAVWLDNGPEILASLAVWSATNRIRMFAWNDSIELSNVRGWPPIFESLNQVRDVSAEWMREYTQSSPMVRVQKTLIRATSTSNQGSAPLLRPPEYGSSWAKGRHDTAAGRERSTSRMRWQYYSTCRNRISQISVGQGLR